MSLFIKKSLFAASAAIALMGIQLVSSPAHAQDPPPPPPKPADEIVPSREHHFLNSSPVLDRRHSDSADTEARIRRSRRFNYAPYVYQPYYYYYYFRNTNPGMVKGPAMYFPDPGSYAYGYTADGVGYGF